MAKTATYWRVQPIGRPLDPEQKSWPIGWTQEQAEREELLIDGVSCCRSSEALFSYFQGLLPSVDAHPSTLYGGEVGHEVVAFEGTDEFEADWMDSNEIAAKPIRELARFDWSELIAAYDEEAEWPAI